MLPSSFPTDIVRIVGKLSNDRRWRPNNKFFYEVEYKDGQLVKDDIFIDEGTSVIGLATGGLAAAAKLFGSPIPPEAAKAVAKKVEDYVVRNWQDAGKKLILRISWEGYTRMHGVTAYTKKKYRGQWQTFTPGVYEAKNLKNDAYSSFKVAPGYKVKACRHSPSVGQCKTYTGNVWALAKRMDNNISQLTVTALDEQTTNRLRMGILKAVK